MVNSGITRDAFSQKVAVTGAPQTTQSRTESPAVVPEEVSNLRMKPPFTSEWNRVASAGPDRKSVNTRYMRKRIIEKLPLSSAGPLKLDGVMQWWRDAAPGRASADAGCGRPGRVVRSCGRGARGL